MSAQFTMVYLYAPLQVLMMTCLSFFGDEQSDRQHRTWNLPVHCPLVHIVTWNVCTLYCPGQYVRISREMAKLNISFAGLTETLRVALLLQSSTKHALVSWMPVTDRLLMACLRHQTIFGTYAPNYLPKIA